MKEDEKQNAWIWNSIAQVCHNNVLGKNNSKYSLHHNNQAPQVDREIFILTAFPVKDIMNITIIYG